MISRLIRSFLDFVRNPARSFKERIFVLMTIIVELLGFFALIGDIAIGENIVEIVALAITVLAVPVVTIMSVRQNWIMLAFRVIVIYIVVLLLPILFFFGGGIHGGGFIWFIFAYLYTGLVLSGRWKPVMMTILTLEIVLFFAIAYYNPELIIKHSQEKAYIDVMLSVIFVGLIGCMLLWFEEWLLREENKRSVVEKKKVEDLIRTQSRFFSSMSHEIRTPINSILGLNEVILRQEDASDEIKNDARNIQGAGKMLLTLINDILDVSKIEAGKMDIVPINYNLGDMISEIVNMMLLRANQKGLVFNVEIDPSIPAELFGDEVRIKQILVNLLNNAVKYTSQGSVTLHIEKDEMKGDEVLLLFSVIDTGMGIKQDAMANLFDAFQRVDEQKNAKVEGTGLGLTIVKQLVDLMEGKITVNSVYTEGTTFVVALWQKVTRREAIGELNIDSFGKKQYRGKYVPQFTAPDVRLLIVDDNEMNLEVEKKLLEGTRMLIDTAGSGQEAIYLTGSVSYDVIFMDHLMPEMDGIECMQIIRKQVGGLNNHTPVIILTANADSENVELYNRSGFDGYLLKPVSGQQLENMLLEHLPEGKIVMTEGSDLERTRMSSIRGYSKKIPVVIATSSLCDLPAQVLRAYQIDIIPFYVISGEKTYYDLLEAGIDEVMRYVDEGVPFDSLPPSVTDFEQFFANEVKKAHQVIYIAMSSDVTLEYENAKQAAMAFGNVRVIDSRQTSSALGLVVLLAQKMAIQGRSFEKIIEELEHINPLIHCSFVTANADLVLRKAGYSRVLHNLAYTFSLKPVIHIKNGIIKAPRTLTGENTDFYRKYLDYALPKTCNPDLELIIVMHMNLSEQSKDIIRGYIRRKFAFETIFFQKVSSVMALNCGREAMGVVYLKRGAKPYNLVHMLGSVLESEEENDQTFGELGERFFQREYDQAVAPLNDSAPGKNDSRKEVADNAAQEADRAWYEDLPGIDYEKALENSGSEDAFKSVLRIFYDSIDERSAEIEDFYKNGDYANYTVKVHALKSSARLVGAMELSEKALALEEAGKENNIDRIKSDTDKLLADFRKYKVLLAPIFTEDSGAEALDLNKQLMNSLYEAIRDAAQNKDDARIEGILKEAKEVVIPAKECENLDRIREAFDKKDYEAILFLSKN